MKEQPSRLNTDTETMNVIDVIRKYRNDLIKDFLDERHLKEYIGNRYALMDLSFVKTEFIKKDLRELLIAPVDVGHYEGIIELVKNGLEDMSGNDELFYQEISRILKKHIY